MTITRLLSWQPIDTVPHDGTEVLLAWHTEFDLPWSAMDSGGGDVVTGHCINGVFVMEGNMELDDATRPTHWAPKPAPPKFENFKN